MTALLNMNPTRYISWKGKTFYQITAQITKNQNTNTSTSTRNLRLPPPCKVYRREIATPSTHCGSRNTVSIDQLNIPNGYLVSETAPSTVGLAEGTFGLVNVLDISSSNNKYENGDCVDPNTCVSTNALRRVRSSGMVKRKFVASRNNDTAYFTNTTQYLVSRNRTFTQNQYRHVRVGDASLINTVSQSKTNVYSPNGLSHCPLTTITTGVNDTFYYVWVDFDTDDIATVKATPDNAALKSYKVVIPPGSYDINQLNARLKFVMGVNRHYYVNKVTGASTFLLNIIYNTVQKRVEIQTFSTSIVSDPTVYRNAPNEDGSLGADVSFGGVDTTPAFYFPASGANAGSVFGFTTGFYPNIESAGTNETSNSNGMVSNTSFTAHPLYDTMYYKPSNTRFAVQGAVSSSDRVTRVKYDTITRNGLSYQIPYGQEVAHALAYGVPGNAYTLKDKYGYPNKKTPVLCKSSQTVRCVDKLPNPLRG